jgi:hypothetical protein
MKTLVSILVRYNKKLDGVWQQADSVTALGNMALQRTIDRWKCWMHVNHQTISHFGKLNIPVNHCFSYS